MLRKIARLLDRLEGWLSSRPRRRLCGICAHAQGSHNYDPSLDEDYCSRCRMGADLHGFKELEGTTMRSCDACGKLIKPWQKSTDFEVMTTLRTPVRLHTHDTCADTAAAAAHMKPHRRTLLCALLGCNSSSD